MRINSQYTTGSSDDAGKAFGFERTAEAFQLLSSTLYSNKPRAIIRELSCNALDAHTSVGKQHVPFEVKIPNSLDAQFHVKDFGPGMSHQDVLSLYTTYFKSTKQENDDLIGGFGVGSKSPFAYTDSFTVESRHEGRKKLYSAYLNDSGIPEMALMFDTETDEPTGLTVGFPVKSADFKAFEHEARSVLDVFKVKPTMLGMVLQPLDRGSSIYASNELTVRQSKNHHDVASVVIGAVEYPLNKYRDSLHGSSNDWQQWLINKNIVFNVPIGQLTVAVSREDLAYDKATLKALSTILKEGLEQMLTAMNSTDISVDKAEELRSIFKSADDSLLRKMLFDLFPEKDFSLARDRIIGKTAYSDLPAVEVVSFNRSHLHMMESVPRHRFGEYKTKYPLYEHTTKHKMSRALQDHWNDIKDMRVEIAQPNIKYITMELPSAELKDRMLALDVLSKQIGASQCVLLVPSSKNINDTFEKQAAETIARWGVSAIDLTDKWKAALADFHGPNIEKNSLPLYTKNDAAASTKKRTIEKNWCFNINISNIDPGKLDTLSTKIRSGLDPKKLKKKTWQPLPTIDPRLETEEVWYIEYDVKKDTYDGMKSWDIAMLLMAGRDVLNMSDKHIVVIPTNSEHISKSNWWPYSPAWVKAFESSTYANSVDSKLKKFVTTNQSLNEELGSSWHNTEAAKLFKELPSDLELLTTPQILDNAIEAVERKIGPLRTSDKYRSVCDKIITTYPLLKILINEIDFSKTVVAQHVLEYLNGQDLINKSSLENN